MKLTRFLKRFEGDAPGSCILVSSKKGSVISVPSKMTGEIDAGKISEEEQSVLSSMGFMCESPEAETREMLCFVDEINAIARTFAAKVAMNLDCNLACRYCFEGQRKGHYFMSQDTADLLVNFINGWTERLDGRTGEEKIILTFYGGEPLLSLDLVAYISKRIKELAEKKSIEYVSYIITNGTLLTKRAVKRLSPLGLQGAVVTIDGPKEVHDSFRPFKGGAGSFDTILMNLCEVWEILGLRISGNYMSHNYREFPPLLDYMLANGLTPERIESVGYNPVTVESDGYGPVDFHEGCCSVNEPWLFDAGVYLRGEALKRGYKVTRGVTPGVCSLDMEDQFLVNYEGSLYKCPGLIGREEFKIGDLRTGIIHERDSPRDETPGKMRNA